MAAQLANGLCCTMHCSGVNEQIALLISNRGNDWRAESAMIAST